jgi:predicted transcriptional regulator
MFDNVSEQEYIDYTIVILAKSKLGNIMGEKITLEDKIYHKKASSIFRLKKYIVAIYEGLWKKYKPPSNAVI